MRRTLRYNLVDVFTDIPLTGNPLAVFTSGQGLETSSMQNIAREMNLSETVFFLPPADGGHAKIRIFTPQRELPFAGHPVLGSAWVLGQPMEMEELRLETGAGQIRVSLTREGGLLHVAWMEQPLPKFGSFSAKNELAAALGIERDEAREPVAADNGPQHVLLEVTEDEFEQLKPNQSQLAELVDGGLYVYTFDGERARARYFAPGSGINEDPATGSAAGPLGARLTLDGRLKSGQRLVVAQGEAMKRPSSLLVEVDTADGALSQVRVGGAAVVVGRGELLL